ncbi:plantaricin C family lantibiotic [Kroppenstedtia pulmonis]|uniref:Lantibiotic n=1 Tax=Kroppenstedtia pulmonis TaxID=1380685 RepID=A0A7D4BIL7_9BACL|nr:plantaricin C family lantibiotic [Kroppenstedtia pulmonis]QKG85535.1 plantaricin C family lantibiotic [Kroppenstedtia pulmonis]
MTKDMIVKAWKDPFARPSNAPSNPAGDVYMELEEAELDQVVGGTEAQAFATIGAKCTVETCSAVIWC